MEQGYIVVTSIICGTVFLSILVLVMWRLKVQKLNNLRKLMEEGAIDQDQVLQSLLPRQARYHGDFRRGVLLIGLGFSIGVVFFFLGGVGWKLALIPIVTGLIYLWFWWLNAPKK